MIDSFMTIAALFIGCFVTALMTMKVSGENLPVAVVVGVGLNGSNIPGILMTARRTKTVVMSPRIINNIKSTTVAIFQ
jgi:hypothetical protein